MSIDDIITLEDNKEYLILDIRVVGQEKYLYCVGIDKEENPTQEYNYFKEIQENRDIYVEEIRDKNVLESLIFLFTKDNFNDNINKNEEQDV